MTRVFRGTRVNPPEEYYQNGLTNGPSAYDYEGVVLSDGTVVVKWLTDVGSISIFKDFRDFKRIHGHKEYGTQYRWAKLTWDTPEQAQREIGPIYIEKEAKASE